MIVIAFLFSFCCLFFFIFLFVDEFDLCLQQRLRQYMKAENNRCNEYVMRIGSYLGRGVFVVFLSVDVASSSFSFLSASSRSLPFCVFPFTPDIRSDKNAASSGLPRSLVFLFLVPFFCRSSGAVRLIGFRVCLLSNLLKLFSSPFPSLSGFSSTLPLSCFFFFILSFCFSS